MYERKTVPIRIGDRIFQITSDDEYLNGLGEVFEPPTVDLFRALVQPTDTVLDIGANIGCTVLLLSTLARRVIGFEPSPTTYEFLQHNVGDARCLNVETVNAGLGHEDAELKLNYAPNNRSGGFVSNGAVIDHTVETIEILEGDKYVESASLGPINFIKIDVEGFETNVIKGLARTITRNRPVVAMELNHWCLNAFQRTSVPDFFDFLRTVFPILYAVDADDVKNLNDPAECHYVMHEHIVRNRYSSIVAAFEGKQIEGLLARYLYRNPLLLRLEHERKELLQTIENLSASQQEQFATQQRMKSEYIREVEAQKAEIASHHAEISKILQSKSWRLTAPLRAARRLFG